MKILCVDDEPFFLDIIRTELASLGYVDVEQVKSGKEALKLVEQSPESFDCFLLDIDMPEMDGVALCEHLRNTPDALDATIIMVTSRSEVASVDRAFSVGATDYLNKPLNPLELRGRLKSAENFAALRKQKLAAHTSSETSFDFDLQDAIRLDPAAGCIEYVAMQNYLLKLGMMKMFNRVALGIHVTNVEDFFAYMSREHFRDILSDVSEVIVDGLGPCPKVMSYAGSGDFVLLLDRTRVFDIDQIHEALSSALMPLGDWYSDLQLPVPTLKIGKPISRNLFNLFAVEDVLEQAISNAREGGQEIRFVPSHVLPKTQKSKGALAWI